MNNVVIIFPHQLFQHHPALDSNRNVYLIEEFLFFNRAHAHLADQGDGNHFAYLGEVDVTPGMLALLRLTRHHELAASLSVRKYRVLVTHHGSRSLGAHVYKRGQVARVRSTSRARRSTFPRRRRGSMRSSRKAATTGTRCSMSRAGRRRTIARSTAVSSSASAALPWRRSATSTTSSGSAATCSSTARARLRRGRMPTDVRNWA